MLKDFPIISTLCLTWGISKLKNCLFPQKTNKTIKSDKPILIIDPFKTLLNYKFTWNFNILFTKRPYTEEFLFNLGYIYDIALITDNNLANRKIFNFVDPLGISTYKIFAKNLQKEIENIKKNNKVIILDNTNKQNDTNYLNIKSFNEKSREYELLDVVNFLTTLKFLNVENYSKILESYKNRDFYTSFDKIQKQVYKMRNMLNIFKYNKYEKIKEEIYKEKIKNYKKSKEEILKSI
ncbi:mitochondrial import inner membrane translocase subunit TIM50 [Vairimorpha necatrix]|uniref:Mitochondrial import inner membrane translocase subunit TIM50 n=1 Tax=Vairimorpha necatrix TaxID=6039 RepID=A0AAX4JDV8_9MICR